MQTPTADCFAYVKGGDLWYQCGGAPREVTHSGNIVKFAVGGGYVALAHWRAGLEVIAAADARVVRREPMGTSAPTLIFASCGSILEYLPKLEYSITLPSGSIADPCLPWLPDRDLKSYRVSPNGRYVAALALAGACVWTAWGSGTCGSGPGEGRGGFNTFSMSDAGELVYQDGMSAGCYFNDVGAQTPTSAPRPRGYSEDSECSGIYSWTPGTKSSRLLAPYATAPQCLGRDDAAALARLADLLANGKGGR